ncbi:MAG: transcriptional repressor [Proteobacteria bacterium]|nr:transcriptional repressor [Pseudomonadota bacterium]
MDSREILPSLLHRASEFAAHSVVETCPVARLKDMLRRVGLRPTRQRMLLGSLLFSGKDRHVSAEVLYQESQAARSHLSLATIYNTLNQFSDAGLLRKVAVFGDRAIYDTNVGDHHHFLVEDDGTVIDVPDVSVSLSNMPDPPPGYRIVGVDVVVRLVRVEGEA